MLEDLNKEQLRAVKNIYGPMLVIAGAGSGKTRTLVNRIVYMMKKDIDPEHILLLTFTRKAAREMLERASKATNEDCDNIEGGTFHSFALKTLKKHCQVLGYSNNFVVLDPSDSKDLMTFIRDMHKPNNSFPNAGMLKNVISRKLNTDEDIDYIITKFYPNHKIWIPKIEDVFESYQKYKKDKNLMDFDDLIFNLRKLLKIKSVRKRLAKKHRYILVDEYQDTNLIQRDIIRLFGKEHHNIMATGDDQQSIYSFRGAEVKNILEFPKDFKNAKIVKITQNYRSINTIVSLSNQIVESAREKYDKELFSTIVGTEKPIYYRPKSEENQAIKVVEIINKLLEKKVEPNKIGVLFRMNKSSNLIEAELMKYKIPFIKYGGMSFIGSRHIKDILAFMRILTCKTDTISWFRTLNMIPGVGSKTINSIIENVLEEGYRGLEYYKDKKYGNKIEDLHRMIKKCRSYSPKKTVDITRTILKYYEPYFKKIENESRRKDLDSFKKIVSRYKSIKQMVNDLSIDPQEEEKDERGNVILSTIHSSKGLEWEYVFIIDVNEGKIPCEYAKNEDDIEEERRIFYVSCSRAKKKLYLFSPMNEVEAILHRTGQENDEYNSESRFIKEIKNFNDFVEKYN